MYPYHHQHGPFHIPYSQDYRYYGPMQSPHQPMPHQSQYYAQQPFQSMAPVQQPFPTTAVPYQQQQASPFMSSFMTPEGKFDFQKTFHTVDQIVKTANQIPPVLKQFSSLLPKR